MPERARAAGGAERSAIEEVLPAKPADPVRYVVDMEACTQGAHTDRSRIHKRPALVAVGFGRAQAMKARGDVEGRRDQRHHHRAVLERPAVMLDSTIHQNRYAEDSRRTVELSRRPIMRRLNRPSGLVDDLTQSWRPAPRRALRGRRGLARHSSGRLLPSDVAWRSLPQIDDPAPGSVWVQDDRATKPIDRRSRD